MGGGAVRPSDLLREVLLLVVQAVAVLGTAAALAIWITLLTTGAEAADRRQVRLPNGHMLHVGDSRVEVLDELGPPHAQQGPTFFYAMPGGLGLMGFVFDWEGRLAAIQDTRR